MMNEMRDRLVELIRSVQYLGGLEEKVADHLIENGVIVPQWISVKDRLPEIESSNKRWGNHKISKSVRVLCACKQASEKVFVKEGYYEIWDDERGPFWKIPGSIDSVTHWMPLPEPPKKGGADNG